MPAWKLASARRTWTACARVCVGVSMHAVPVYHEICKPIPDNKWAFKRQQNHEKRSLPPLGAFIAGAAYMEVSWVSKLISSGNVPEIPCRALQVQAKHALHAQKTWASWNLELVIASPFTYCAAIRTCG
eukprot:5474881-Pleurochrysis_carterae.AAC.2